MSEALKAVKYLNDKLFNEPVSDMDYFQYLELVCTPIGDYIKYMGCYIWDSENDPREWDEEGENQEPLEQYLIKQMVIVNKVIKKSIRVLGAGTKAFDKLMESRLSQEELREDMLRKAQELIDEQLK